MLSQAKIRRFELLSLSGVPAWVAQEHCYGPLGLGVTDMALRLSRQRGGARPSGTESCPFEYEAIFNFPLHAEQRSLFVLASAEVVAAHAFCMRYLGLPPGVLCPAVVQAMAGSLVRYRAARGLALVAVQKPPELPL